MDESRFQLTHGDAVAWLRGLPAASIDLVITDPPYESLEKHRAIGTTTRLKHSKSSSNDWFSIFPNARFPELFAEIYRVLKKDSHFYLFCDPETMFVAKPLAEESGFKFWKPLIWDKCLGPDTLVWTARGVQRIADIVVGDSVALPNGGTTRVRATRRTRSPSVRIELSDGTKLVASRDHRFVRDDGSLVEAAELRAGDRLRTRPVRDNAGATKLSMDDVIPEHDAVDELPELTRCLWCSRELGSPRAAAAHQARWCHTPVSKHELARRLGVRPKRLRRWMRQRRLPRVWAEQLGLDHELGSRVQTALQNDAELGYPRELDHDHDHELGKIVGLFAAEGSAGRSPVSFALHRHEKHLHSAIARFARWLGVRSRLRVRGRNAVVEVNFKVMRHLMRRFVGGRDAKAKFFTPPTYAAPNALRDGIVNGLLEGDGHWSRHEQRETYVSASPDLTMFVRRELQDIQRAPTIRQFDNAHAGGWRVRVDPQHRDDGTCVTAIDDIGMQDLVDISIEHPDELFLLANGVVTHNCKIGMGYHYRARYECVLFFEKGKRKLHDLGTADIIEVPRINGGYPAEKPPEVAEVLITQSSEPGALVIDPFMGSGSTGAAAVRQRRNFAGNDLCAEAIEIARARLVELGAREGRIELADARDEERVPQLGLTL
jgi:DNA modification methylase